MIGKIGIGGSLRSALEYNQQKVDKEKGKVLECNLVATPADGRFNVAACMADFERTMPSHVRTTRGIVHISLNPHPEDKLSDERLAEIAREYIERMGFGGQPWMIFKHEDIDREHLHIVTTRVRGDGTLISDKNNFERSRKITDALEREYGLHPKGERQGEAWQLRPIDQERGDLKRQVANAIKPLSEMYRFRSLSEYRALLSLYNIGVEKVEGDNKGHRYTGLVYSALDADGNRVGQPLKSSLFGKKYGVAGLEQTMAKSGEAIKAGGAAAKTKGIVSAALSTARTGSEFRAELRGKGIDLVLRHNDAGRLYGVTFIDHKTRSVLNGSALGKEFSANALSARFADFSPTGREDLQAPAPSSVGNEPAPTMTAAPTTFDDTPQSVGHTAPDNGGPTTDIAPSHDRAPAQAASDAPASGHRHGGSTPGGGLLSLLAPEPGPSSNNGPAMPKPKKKKRRYGRQQ